MKRYSQSGGIALVLSDVFLIAALIASLVFGWWAFGQRQDYKNNFDKKVKEEVAKAETVQKSELEAEFAEREKSPSKTFSGSATYGSITFTYPKIWSGYVDQNNTSTPINGYFFPDIVPAVNSGGSTPTAYALRVELVAGDYTQLIKQFDSQIQQGKLTASAYVPPKMTGVANVQTGTRLDGELEANIRGAMVVIKVRDKTLKIYTQSSRFLADFNETILKSLTFAP